MEPEEPARQQGPSERLSRLAFIGVILALAWTLPQGFATLVIAGAEAKRTACESEWPPAFFTVLGAVAFAGVLIATPLSWKRPRRSLFVLAVVALVSITWSVLGGWGAANCIGGI